jgi:hypothetical protein
MIFIIFIINIPRVSWIPQVSFDTVQFMGWVQVVPAVGTVCHGAGMVWENPTRGLPVLNPILDNYKKGLADRICKTFLSSLLQAKCVFLRSTRDRTVCGCGLPYQNKFVFEIVGWTHNKGIQLEEVDTHNEPATHLTTLSKHGHLMNPPQCPPCFIQYISANTHIIWEAYYWGHLWHQACAKLTPNGSTGSFCMLLYYNHTPSF